MRNIIIIVTLLCIFRTVFSQDIEKTSFSTELVGSGTISTELKIKMSLNLIDRIHYSSDGCHVKTTRQVIGTYQYEKNGGSINLLGEITLWTLGEGETEKTDFKLFELNDNFEKIAEFEGAFSDTNFVGTWTLLSSKRSLPFLIKFESNYGQGLKLYWETNTYIVNEVNMNSTQNEFKLLDKFSDDKNLIVIYRVTSPYCGRYNCRGANCGSREDFLHLYVISKEKQLSFFKKLTKM